MRKILLISALLFIVCLSVMAAETNIEVHGYMQNRLYSGSGANTQFRSERISLSTKATLPNDNLAYIELYYHPWTSSNGLYLESAYLEVPMGEGKLKIGKGRRTTFGMTPSYPNRKTSNYGIVAEAATQDRTQGLQYAASFNKTDVSVGVHTGYRLGIRNIGEIPGDDQRNNATSINPGHVVPHLSLRDPHSGGGNATQTPNQLSDKIQISARVGTAAIPSLNVGVSGSFGTLDSRDLANLQGASSSDNILRPKNPINGTSPSTPIGASFKDDKVAQLGLDASYKTPKGVVLQGEYYDCGISDLDYKVWCVLAGYEMPSGWKVYAKYSKQNMDITPTDNPLTWDTSQTTLSVVQTLRKNLWLQYEYEINGEKTNTGKGVSNNIFFVELFSAF